jgi:hypothetical protein
MASGVYRQLQPLKLPGLGENLVLQAPRKESCRIPTFLGQSGLLSLAAGRSTFCLCRYAAKKELYRNKTGRRFVEVRADALAEDLQRPTHEILDIRKTIGPRQQKQRWVHFVGIGGSGLSALALVAVRQVRRGQTKSRTRSD